MNLAFKYPIIFWNTACLISDAGGNEIDEEDIDEEAIEENKKEEPYIEEMEWFNDDEDKIVSSYEEDDGENGFPATIIVTETGKKKKKAKATNYGKIATAIGKMRMAGIAIAQPDINSSKYTFSPDVEKNEIKYGLSGITRIGEDLIKDIIANRPYESLEDFLNKVKVNKTQAVNLIKCGAFDGFGERKDIMASYINMIYGEKKRMTLQNLNMLINFGFIPDEFDMVKRVFNFNKYLKKMKLDNNYYGLDNIAFGFYEQHFDIDKLNVAETESGFKIGITTWKSYYDKYMNEIRPFVKSNAAELLEKVNTKLFNDMWDKYCIGSYSKWEMDSVSCYSHEHELAHVNMDEYGLVDFFELDEKPLVDKIIPIKGKHVPIYKLDRICGTVLDRDKAKKMVTLLTREGVVTVKIYGGVFANYDKQISERGADGKKHVIEKSAFSRGNKIVVSGVRDGDAFLCKTYNKTPWHKVELIREIRDDGSLVIVPRQEIE